MAALHILVIDDEAAINVVLGHAAEGWGHQVTSVRTIAEARAALATDTQFDLLVIDVGLPDGSGLDLLTELRATPEHADRPTIVLTGAADHRLEEQGARLNARFVTKPFSPTKLGMLIDEMMADPGDKS